MQTAPLNLGTLWAPIAQRPLPCPAAPASPPRRRPGLRLCPAGLLAGLLSGLCPSGAAATRYVDVNSAAPAPPYTTWATAATSIQDAVDAADAGEEILVTNGVYQTGAREVHGSNRVAVTKPVTVRSVNGPAVTVIDGSAAARCAYLTNGAVLAGFTLTNGAARLPDVPHDSYLTDDNYLNGSGAGAWCEGPSAMVSNCVLTANSADWNGGGAYRGTLNHCTLTGNRASSSYLDELYIGPRHTSGGGAYGGMLNHCTLTGNSAHSGGGAHGGTLNHCTLTGNRAEYGGGACGSTLNNCTLTGNRAYPLGRSMIAEGGGAYGSTLNNCTLTGNSGYWNCGGAAACTLNNCIAFYNTASIYPDYWEDNYDSCTLNYCCTTPLPASGTGNITLAPLFVDTNGWSDLRLQATSPCVNAGNNEFAPGMTDLDGNPRIVGGTVDMGAYEFQGPGSVISYAWLQGYGLPTEGSADFADPDADGHTTWQEWRCQTDPTNALSVLRLLSAARAGPNVTVTWQGVAGVSYFLERSTNLSASPPFTLLAPNLPGQPGVMSFTDTNAAAAPLLFYRVAVP